jgi:hypothetical protein
VRQAGLLVAALMLVLLRQAATPMLIIICLVRLAAQQAVLQAALAILALTFAIILIHPALVVEVEVEAPRLVVLVVQVATTALAAVEVAQVARLEPWAAQAEAASFLYWSGENG